MEKLLLGIATIVFMIILMVYLKVVVYGIKKDKQLQKIVITDDEREFIKKKIKEYDRLSPFADELKIVREIQRYCNVDCKTAIRCIQKVRREKRSKQ